jgi:hypothetical protein
MAAEDKMREMMIELTGKGNDKLSQIQNVMEALLKTNLELTKELKEEKFNKERLPEKALVLLQGDKGDRGDDADEEFIIKEVKKQVMDEIVVPKAPTKKELLDLIEPLIPDEPIIPTVGEIKQAVLEAITMPVVPTYPEIARGLEGLEGDERLDYDSLKNKPNLAALGGGSSNFAIQADGVEVVSSGYNTLNFVGATIEESNGVVAITVGGGSSTLQDVTDNGATTTNSITIQNATGITYGDGTDQDMDLITVDRASTDAKLEWDDSIEGFKFNGGSTGVVIGSDGDLTHTIGGTSVTSQLEIHSEGSGNLGGIAIHRHSNTNNFGGHQLFLRSDGTHASPTIVTDNQILGRMIGLGYDGTDYEPAAEIRFITDGTPANNNMPGEIAFYTNAGSQTLTKRMSIRADGSLDLDAYGSGTFTGTATYNLAVDSSGNIIEVAAGGATPDLQDVTDVGATTTNAITTAGITAAATRTGVDSEGEITLSSSSLDITSSIDITGTNYVAFKGVLDWSSDNDLAVYANGPTAAIQGRFTITGNGDLGDPVSSSAIMIHSGTGTIADAYGYRPVMGLTSTGTVTDLVGYGEPLFFNLGGGTVTNAYGIRLGDITAGSTSNYAIKTGAGLVEFGDATSITSTSSQLELAYNGTNGVDFAVDASNNFTMTPQTSGGYFAYGASQIIGTSPRSIILGDSITANGADDSVILGRQASATAGDSVVLGYLAGTQSGRTVVIGSLSDASGSSAGDSTTIGYNVTTSGRYAVSLGSNFTNSLQNTFQVGFNGDQSFFVNANSNLMLNSQTAPTAGTHFDTSATNTLTVHAGTAPSGQISGAAQIYAESGGTLVIDRLLKRYNGSGTTPTLASSTLAVFQNNADTADDAYISIIGGDTGDAGINFGISTDENAGQIRYETNTNPDRFSIYVEGGTINVRHSNTQHTFYKSGGVAVQIYDYFTSTVMSGAGGAAPWMWMNTSYNVTRPQYASYQDTDTGLAFPSAGLAQITVGGQEKLKVNSSGYLSVNANGFTQLYQTQITTTDDAIVDSDTLDVSGTTLLIHRNDNTNNAGVALGFAAGTANTNIGAMIAFERTNTNSQGRLRFGVKTDTGSGSDIEDNMAINDDGKVHFFDDSIVVSTSKTPSSASDTGTQGEVAWDADYIYICTATDTWKRAAIATW